MAALSLEKIEAIAPDQASLSAARKLLKPGVWSGLQSDGAELAWGECQGSGATPYRVAISETDAGYKCTCPSRKFPCKHCLALMWMRAEGKTAFGAGAAPEWVQDWLRRRRPGAAADASPNAGDEDGRERRAKSIALTAKEEPSQSDPKSEARAAAARERGRKEREDAIAAGLDDLEQWLADQIETGLAGFAAHAAKSCRVIAQRLVDAKAPGLAGRIESLPARLYALPEARRSRAAVEELGQLHLLAEAYRRQDALAPDLRADVRREIGWAPTRESLLADETALRVTATWRVAGTFSEVQPDRLRRVETWLMREDAEEGPRYAVLIDYVPVVATARSAYLLGERLKAALVFYPSDTPMRALIGEVSAPAQACAEDLALPEDGLEAALLAYDRALCAKPWLGAWPMSFRKGKLRRSGEQLFLCPADGAAVALPLLPAQAHLSAPLLALESIDGVGLWDGNYLRLCLAQTEFGRWGSE
ncbi:MAG: SWIM zinc finger family protein [Terracidiphilus sp.]